MKANKKVPVEKVECLLCGKKFSILSNRHLPLIHKMTEEEYLQLFPGAKLFGNHYRVLGSIAMQKQWDSDYDSKREMAVEAFRNAAIDKRGVHRTDEVRKKIGDAQSYLYRTGKRKIAEGIGHGNGQRYITRDGEDIYLRSDWERKFAEVLDLFEVRWSYEPKTFTLPGTTYRPDFYLTDFDMYVEIKTTWNNWLNVFLSGKGRLMADNHSDVAIYILCNPRDYTEFIREVLKLGELREVPTSQQLEKWCLTTLLEHNADNLQPTSSKDIGVDEKVQRLAIEESTNKIATSTQHIEKCDDIVCSALKDAAVIDKHYSPIKCVNGY